MNNATPLTRRSILRQAGLGALLSGLPSGWVGSAYADDSPETADIKLGIIALTDCSPIVIAHEKGLFKKFGINSTVSKEASWAVIRDKLVTGENQATHMLLGMPIASTMGLGGSAVKEMVFPWILNRNGQAITLSNKFKGTVAGDPKALKPLVDEAKAGGTPLTFAMTFPPGTHAMWLRYYLAAGGINPDSDITLTTIPPPQMVANMKVGKMDGYCVGEPWNARAIAEDIGYTSVATQEIWKNHPEKVCAFTKEFSEKNPKTVKAVLKALHEASVWLDDLGNRKEQVEIISAASYVNCPPEVIYSRLMGELDYGDGRTKKDEDYMMFSGRNCNYPQPKFVKWWLSQFRRWGMVEGTPDYDGVAKATAGTALYEEAMKEIGYTGGKLDDSPETFMDGAVFDPAKAEEFATSAAIKNLKG
ncbi:CmpA/NrtA family ABC transporter substrate-binding protein [Prosthecobacter sp.]|jgi:nitrate/nitrite transport system substrate-binding protein|uniref:CmpA/NrtA family ABC transporter substrate-binding protein n=1 Tax=Prosthecobacter sp. TaxID=1965333 RepID=UPI00378471F3